LTRIHLTPTTVEAALRNQKRLAARRKEQAHEEALPENLFLLNPSGRHYTLADLQALPTLHVGQFDDLKAQPCPTVRIWLSRLGIADGELCEHKVTVEDERDGRWVVRCTYEAT